MCGCQGVCVGVDGRVGRCAGQVSSRADDGMFASTGKGHQKCTSNSFVCIGGSIILNIASLFLMDDFH